MLTQNVQQFQYLADKYAPAAPEIAETLAKLQLPPHTSVDSETPVPLLKPKAPNSQAELALVIRDGRRVANQLASLGEASKTTCSSRDNSFSHMSREPSSMSTTLEQDFTVEGKKGHLQCPFSKPATASGSGGHEDHVPDTTPHHSADPICAAMYEETTSQHAATNGSQGAGKCPIRYLDKHSPEEIAHYVETHKHELPRSHEVCLRRYQRNEDQIKKIDSKYGDIVSMIEGLGQLHQPMLPEAEDPLRQSDVDQASNERVENWAQAVSVNTHPEDSHEIAQVDDGRESHFDRPMKEVRVGESPSRPWGISVPVYEPSGQDEDEQPMSPPPAPVRMPSSSNSAQTPVKPAGKCPFDHTKLSSFAGIVPDAVLNEAQCPITPGPPSQPQFTPMEDTTSHPPPAQSFSPSQPAFISPEMTKGSSNAPQMIFTGPVFIGYPMEQAIQFMNQYRGNQ